MSDPDRLVHALIGFDSTAQLGFWILFMEKGPLDRNEILAWCFPKDMIKEG